MKREGELVEGGGREGEGRGRRGRKGEKKKIFFCYLEERGVVVSHSDSVHSNVTTTEGHVIGHKRKMPVIDTNSINLEKRKKKLVITNKQTTINKSQKKKK